MQTAQSTHRFAVRFLVQHLRLRRSGATARELARKLAVSERTIYRDVRDLGRSGVPIDGEAGVGYILRGFDVPPLMFTREEIEALVVGARMVETWTTDQLSAAARQALAKIEAALPESAEGYLCGQAGPGYGPGTVRAGAA